MRLLFTILAAYAFSCSAFTTYQ